MVRNATFEPVCTETDQVALAAMAREARAEGARAVRLNTSVQSVEANAMYTRCGFTRHRPIWLPYPELPMPGWTNLWELRLDA